MSEEITSKPVDSVTSQAEIPATESASPPVASVHPPSPDSSTPPHILGCLAAAGLLISFFLPWINLLGGKFTGMDVQKTFASYKFVWIMPLLAIIALVLNIARLPAKPINWMTGLSPFVILAYAAYRLNANLSDLFKLLEFGSWIALVCGLVLVVAPQKVEKPTMPPDHA